MLSVWLPLRANAGHRGPRRPAPLDAMRAAHPATGGGMAYLPERALPDTFGAFVALRQGPGLVPDIFLAQVVRPRAIEAEAGIAGAVLPKKRELSRIQKELILLSLAAADANVYCLTAHWEFLRHLGLGDHQIRRAATDHHRAEEARAYLAAIIASSGDAIVGKTLDSVITSWNEAAERMFGYTAAEAVGQQIYLIIPPERHGEEEQLLERLRRGERIEHFETVRLRKDATHIDVSLTVSLIKDSEGHIIGASKIARDITARKRAEEALEKAQAELAHVTRVMTMWELTSSIAHEVNQPLAALVTNASACLRWLTSHPPNLDEARECLPRIIRDGNRASEVITRIRSLVRKSSPAKERLDLGEMIQEVLAIINAEARRQGVVMRTELDAGLPPVRGDRVQLQQVVLNLVMNAIEAMKEVADRPRGLLIKTRPDASSQVLVAVEDNGDGLHEQNVERDFEAFYTTKAEGMGLAISRWIIEAHGGRLWAAASSGHGATFQFTLPSEFVMGERPAASPGKAA